MRMIMMKKNDGWIIPYPPFHLGEMMMMIIIVNIILLQTPSMIMMIRNISGSYQSYLPFQLGECWKSCRSAGQNHPLCPLLCTNTQRIRKKQAKHTNTVLSSRCEGQNHPLCSLLCTNVNTNTIQKNTNMDKNVLTNTNISDPGIPGSGKKQIRNAKTRKTSHFVPKLKGWNINTSNWYEHHYIYTSDFTISLLCKDSLD